TADEAVMLSRIAYAHALIGDADIALQRLQQAHRSILGLEVQEFVERLAEVYGRSAVTLARLSNDQTLLQIDRLNGLWSNARGWEERAFIGVWLAWSVAVIGRESISAHIANNPEQILQETLSGANQTEPIDRRIQQLVQSAYSLPLASDGESP